ncbi:Outer membrane low permeability porin OccK1/OpdK [Pseudomonas chlororaphis subsp. aurantiaca]|uniref:OprD family porin n=1 Tax=Pseudomonas chlororaphis TaxID=587753 RepID=UPI000F579FB7|nr:OprD family porin [Pseudomonas chlororaphis]AZD35435.1 Outer membrane low permeability porin OccK1/OpdK [Pseudomonas chlororaphis subsp. aurantiaca]AZD41768.1 Outer membrane low permeability porin OccK1/OpdK [Pseudomonas chlororaphis subsp. aurantiaca]AZD54419.1 Outer membrane low permeability porin OccK1/OpdK [Pseudomonas chlororaphis subsp. aurantiaca]AZD60485.1 Outer membrane low permeability porin OccK1/OpdK [Pseudomonas chlororaphis subsp. aurantiaca]
MNTPHCILARSLAAASLVLGTGLPAWAEEGGFFEDAKTDLVLRNYYFNRDFRDPGVAKSKVEEWAQGSILKFNSGYTPGVVGFGLDGIAMFGVKLDSGRGTSGSELLPVHDDGRAADNYGRAGVAAKMRISATELKVGELLPDIPLLRYDDGRLLPQTFRGAMLDSREIAGLGLQAGQYRSVSLRNSSDMQDLSAWAAPGVTSDGFTYAGAEYRFNQQRTLVGAWHAQLEDIYQQSYFNLLHKQPVGDWVLGANLGYFIDKDDGQARIGEIQSRTAYALLSASTAGHTLYLGLQKVSGDSPWMSVYGSSGRTLGNDMFNGNFSNADERSWQVRYDYNFAAMGVPGLLAMVRYGHGENATTKAGSNGKEWERDTEVGYTFQSGSLKNLSVRVNNATNRRSFNSDFDQTRVIVSYPLSF